MVWNAIYGSKEARYEDPPDIKNVEKISGPFTEIMKQDYKTLGEPGSHIAVGYSWGINEMDERELLRVSIINELGNLVFDSIIQPTKMIKHVPLFNMYLYAPSFGVPLKYLVVVLN